MNRQVEICCGSYYDVIQAVAGGALRIELNSALYMGGLTPSSAVLKKIKQDYNVEVMVMIRPRGAGFCYQEEDFSTMLLETQELLQCGGDGIVFGCLNEACELQVEQCKQMLKLIKKHHKKAIFHRAFDCVKDPYTTMEQLIALGFDRVLTSGQGKDVIAGKEVLKELQTRYGTQIEILAGCGINIKNAKALMEYTGISQIHSSCKTWKTDPTSKGKQVSYSYAQGNHAMSYECVDASLVKQLIESIK